MSEETERGDTKARVRTVLEILFATREAGDGLDHVPVRDLPGVLRERYWIKLAQDVGRRRKPWPFEARMLWRIERRELGRNRHQPGDDFHYVYHVGTGGAGDVVEWFEVTEVFEGVEPKYLKAFMRVNNGGTAGFAFDPDSFIRGLNMGTPCRAAQRRAADKVVNAVEKKMNKPSYRDMWREHGYATLVVGLPLWFATPPADPLRVNNVLDTFWTRVAAGLEPHARQLAKKDCPFWRIVVKWLVSHESLGEMRDEIKHDAYVAWERKIGGLARTDDSFFPHSKMIQAMELFVPQERELGRASFTIVKAEHRKQAEEADLQLPPKLAKMAPGLEELGRTLRPSSLSRAKWTVFRRAMRLLYAVRAHGLRGLQRWAVTRLSPHRWLRWWTWRQRVLRRYRTSRLRQAARSRRPVTGDSKAVQKR